MNSFRTYKNLVKNDVRTMSDLMFFELLRITLLYNIYETSADVQKYVVNTIIRPISNPFNIRDTDLKGLMVYFADIDDRKLKSQDEILLNSLNVDLNYIHSFLTKIKNKSSIDSISKTVIVRLINDLKIQSPKLRAMASLVIKWDTLTTDKIKSLIKKMNNYGSLYFRRSLLNSKINELDNKYSEAEKAEDNDWLGKLLGGALGAYILKKSIDSRNNNKETMKHWHDRNKNIKSFKNDK